MAKAKSKAAPKKAAAKKEAPKNPVPKKIQRFHYKVIAKGYMFDCIHEPNGKRNSVTVPKKLDPCPPWLELVEEKPVENPNPKAGKAPMADVMKKVASIKEVTSKDRTDLDVI